MKVLVIVNPISGGRKKDVFLRKAKNEFRRFGIAFDIYLTTGDRDEEKLKKTVKNKEPDSVLVIGGDGTINLAVSIVINKATTLGIIPFGSANGMAAELGIDSNIYLALDNFLKSRFVTNVDILWVNEKYFCFHIGDVGLNAQVVEGFTRERDRGITSYAKHFFRELTQSEIIDFSIRADGQDYTEKGYMLAFANAQRYGTGIILNWKGNPYDGKFELVIAQSLELKSLFMAGLSRFDSEIAKEMNSSKIISCRKAKIMLPKPMTIQVDGEIIGKHKEIKIEIIPHSIKVIRLNPEFHS
jgi:YegS/Rv2252/BmrU family lipid kinase